MFRITHEQIQTFDRIARDSFHRRLAAYLREEMPEESSKHDDDALLGFITGSAGRASRHGIETEFGIAQWTCLALVIGLDFDDDPSVREYFEASTVGPEEKLEVLVDGLNEALSDSR